MYNKASFLGYITKDVETKEFENGNFVAKTGIASNRKFKTKDGEEREETTFMDIKFFGNLAKIARDYLQKGSFAFVEGRLVQEHWTDESGEKKSKYYLYANTLRLLDKKEKEQNSNNNEGVPTEYDYSEDEEIPA